MIVTSLITAGCAGRISPPGPVVADRPGYTDAPTALPAGALQFEAGYTDDRVENVRYVTMGETLLRIGVGANTELRLFGNSYAMRKIDQFRSHSGLEDPKIGFKTNLYSKPDSIHSFAPNLSVLAAVTVPVGANGFSATKKQPELKLAANWTTASLISIYSNLGVAHLYSGSKYYDVGWLSTALWYAVNPQVSVFGEGIMTQSLSGSWPHSKLADAGITYLINDRFQIDFRVGKGLSGGATTESFFGGGLAVRW